MELRKGMSGLSNDTKIRTKINKLEDTRGGFYFTPEHMKKGGSLPMISNPVQFFRSRLSMFEIHPKPQPDRYFPKHHFDPPPFYGIYEKKGEDSHHRHMVDQVKERGGYIPNAHVGDSNFHRVGQLYGTTRELPPIPSDMRYAI